MRVLLNFCGWVIAIPSVFAGLSEVASPEMNLADESAIPLTFHVEAKAKSGGDGSAAIPFRTMAIRCFMPTEQGFDYFFDVPYSNNMGSVPDTTKGGINAPIPYPAQVGARINAAKADLQPETGIKQDSTGPCVRVWGRVENPMSFLNNNSRVYPDAVGTATELP